LGFAAETAGPVTLGGISVQRGGEAVSSAAAPFGSPSADSTTPLGFDTRALVASASRYWWLYLASGIVWIAVSAIVFQFNYTSVVAVAVLFGCMAIGAGVMEVMLALASSRGWAVLHAALGAVLIVIGIVAFFRPGATFVGLAAVFGFFFLFVGAWDIASALWLRRETSSWWLHALVGVIELGIGFWAAGSWNVSAVLLVAFTGAAAVLRGVTQILFAFRLHELGESAGEAPPAPSPT
jgi:uncharacterized membrane protein HdeD (DUF308 family)